MSGEATRVSIRILEKEYHVACPPEHRHALLDSAELLNRRMREIRDSGKVIGVERVAIMAALNIAHELLTTRTGGFDIGDFKRRINSMQEQIEQEISEQNELF